MFYLKTTSMLITFMFPLALHFNDTFF